jgi:hypothetical protein
MHSSVVSPCGSDTAAARWLRFFGNWPLLRYLPLDIVNDDPWCLRRSVASASMALRWAGHSAQGDTLSHKPSGAADIVDSAPPCGRKIPTGCFSISVFSIKLVAAARLTAPKILRRHRGIRLSLPNASDRPRRCLMTLEMLQKSNSPTGSEFRLYFRR